MVHHSTMHSLSASGLIMREAHELSPTTLAKAYRKLAEHAHRKAAQTTDDAIRWAHRFMAESWEHLAADLDAGSRFQEKQKPLLDASTSRATNR
jgi:hypothetical protein